MIDSSGIKLALKALGYVEQGLSEKSAFDKCVRGNKTFKMKTLKYALLLLMEISKLRIRYDQLLDKLGFSQEDTFVKHFLYIYLYLVFDANRSIDDLCDFIKIIDENKRISRYVYSYIRRLLELRNQFYFQDVNTEIDNLSFQFALPIWFVVYGIALLGRKNGIKFFKSTFNRLPIYIRINSLKQDEDLIIQQLMHEGVTLSKNNLIPLFYRVEKFERSLVRLNAWRSGLFTIQDLSSGMVGYLADPHPGDSVLDLCAAPGGKTGHMGQLMNNKGKLYSLDSSKKRMVLWSKEMKRLGIDIAESRIVDVKEEIPIRGLFDVVLLDPSCSGTGILMKHPSMKARLNKSSINSYSEMQWNMICAAAKKVKKDGFLIYSTCSITREENEDIIWKFLSLNYDFELVTIEVDGLTRGLYMNECVRFYPHKHRCHGAFIAKLKRSS